jgi:cell fate regulator YaaT (PSP1 superfamily)
MKQIGARQEAGRIGGTGPCGRELCCSTFLSKFTSVGTNAARIQDISMNPQKLAGQCAKLKCCLNFELENYIEALKEFPDKNIVLATTDSEYYFFKLDAFARKMTYSTVPNAPQNLVELPLERVKEIIELNEKGIKPESISSTDGAERPATLDFATAVGEGSLTRFDKKKNKNKKNKKHRPQK